MSQVNPYTQLRNSVVEWIRRVLTRPGVPMFHYPAKTIATDKWCVGDRAERVRAADQLGYEVRLRWSDEGLQVEYVGKLPAKPYWY